MAIIAPDKAIQGVYAGVFTGTEFINGVHIVLKPLLHRVSVRLIFEVNSIRQVEVGRLFGIICSCISEFKI